MLALEKLYNSLKPLGLVRYVILYVSSHHVKSTATKHNNYKKKIALNNFIALICIELQKKRQNTHKFLDIKLYLLEQIMVIIESILCECSQFVKMCGFSFFRQKTYF